MLLKYLNKNEEAVVKAVLCNVAVKKRLFKKVLRFVVNMEIIISISVLFLYPGKKNL